MACTSRFSEVPVVDVNSSNIKELWPTIALALKSSTFVALDTELSGLGNRKLLGARSLPDRYKNISDVAKTRSVLSLGLSCFKLQKVESASVDKITSQPDNKTSAQVQVKQWSYSVQTFNVILLCSEDYMVEPAALKFLVEHGFDFNRQYTCGVPYCRGKGQPDCAEKSIIPKAECGPTARQLFDLLLWSEVPVVLHNGFLDLMFLYQNFYTELPSNMQVFLADLEEMFPQGVLDTKYLVEFVDRLPATYLEYVFRKWQRKNAFQAHVERREVCLEFGRLPVNKAYVSFSSCGLPDKCVEDDFIPSSSALHELICQSFAGHGWCAKGKQCSRSHAIDLILDLDGLKTAKNRKRRHRLQNTKHSEGKNSSVDDNSSTGSGEKMIHLEDPSAKSRKESLPQSEAVEDASMVDISTSSARTSPQSATNKANGIDEEDYDLITEAYLQSSLQLEKSRSGGHRAGFDAFMTGFILACLLSKHTTVDNAGLRAIGAGIQLRQLSGLESLCNKVYAMGKDHPMIVGKSNFCQPSKNHRERKEKLKKA
ncbi:target of EGR1 protein 1-like [Babylonia areolata]|uniref:target of EGR1 protein 1-like n=1 Tax=Babylonia areolata TaxID=304850 RepID=UPI003FD38593